MVRRGYKIMLLGAVAMSVASLVWDGQGSSPALAASVQAAPPAPRAGLATPAAPSSEPRADTRAASTGGAQQRWAVPSADPFHPGAASAAAPLPVVVSSAPASAPAAPPAPPPAPPAATFRYLGQFSAPDGTRRVYLSVTTGGAERDVQAAVGEPLGDGYVVSAISASNVSIMHPLLSAPVSVVLPEPPAAADGAASAPHSP